MENVIRVNKKTYKFKFEYYNLDFFRYPKEVKIKYEHTFNRKNISVTFKKNPEQKFLIKSMDIEDGSYKMFTLFNMLLENDSDESTARFVEIFLPHLLEEIE